MMKISGPRGRGVKPAKEVFGPDKVTRRINRIEGQIRGLKKMYTNNPCDCGSLVQQIQAVRAALGGLARVILIDEARRCAEEGDVEEFGGIIQKIFKSD
jgi:DNA-binding FrmR family transcriptional regulator